MTVSHRRPIGRPGRSRWAAFTRRHGWRAYALPILSALTIVVLVHGTTSSGAARTVAAPRPGGAARQHVPNGSHVAAEGIGGGFPAITRSTPPPVNINLGDDGASCADNTYGSLVLVSISKQHLWACQGSKQVNSTAVTTGATDDGDQTPLGSWRVQAKQRNRYLVGPGYRDYVKYWVPFNGDFGFHDASWQKMRFGSHGYHVHGSHGCVHLPTHTMAWLYRWAQIGQTVVTVES